MRVRIYVIVISKRPVSHTYHLFLLFAAFLKIVHRCFLVVRPTRMLKPQFHKSIQDFNFYKLCFSIINKLKKYKINRRNYH